MFLGLTDFSGHVWHAQVFIVNECRQRLWQGFEFGSATKCPRRWQEPVFSHEGWRARGELLVVRPTVQTSRYLSMFQDQRSPEGPATDTAKVKLGVDAQACLKR